MHAVASRNDNQLCPFCRTPTNSDKEINKRLKKRVELDDRYAIYNIGCGYGCPQIRAKALQLWHRAGELGYSRAHLNIGCAYMRGEGVEVDEKKGIYYWE